MSGFDGNASATDLGLYSPLGYEIVAQSAVYPFPEHYARQIRREIDPNFVPLWLNKWWRSPNGGIVHTGHHYIARHVPHPKYGEGWIANLHLPAFSVYGIRYKTPIVEVDILEGITDQERDQGVLPRYEPFTGRNIQEMRRQMWKRNNERAETRGPEQEAIETERRERARRNNNSEAAYRRRHDRTRLLRAEGLADRAFVSHTLRKTA